jgi:hypothetical protein
MSPYQVTSPTRPASPWTGQTIYETDTKIGYQYDGTNWGPTYPGSGFRNLIINGAMQVAQRGTSVASITADSYPTADRWTSQIGTLGTWTNSVENDAPTGSGFRKSWKWLCTTADASPASGDYMVPQTRLEGQNLQAILKGTSSAKQLTLSFWVKSNVTGTYIAGLFDVDNTRIVSASYTVSASATWEKKTITFPADTTGAFDNDENRSLDIQFWLAAGTGFSSGTLATTWQTNTNANRAAGQVNLAAATSNYWQITGVQLEANPQPTPFEQRPIGVELALCQRYYEKSYASTTAPGTATYDRLVTMTGSAGSATTGEIIGNYYWAAVKRVAPTVTWYDHAGNSNRVTRLQYGVANHGNNVAAAGTVTEVMAVVSSTSGNTGQSLQFHFVADVEL